MPADSHKREKMRALPGLSLVLIALVLCGCSGRKDTPRDAAERFFKSCSSGQFAAAYEDASLAFKLTRTAKYFEARARDLGLDSAKGVRWGEPEPMGKAMRMRGEFSLNDGGRLLLNAAFVEENGRWQLLEARSVPAADTGMAEDVFSVAARTKDTEKTRATDVLEPIALALPSEKQLRTLAEDSLMKFNEAVLNGGDFTALYESASDRWKYRGRDPRELAYAGSNPSRTAGVDPYNEENRLTTAALRNAFDAAVRAQVDLSPIRGSRMILTEPARINSDGVLRMAGTFDCLVKQGGPSGIPRKLDFMLEYVFESSTWKLFGITVNLVVPTTAGRP
jgi:hypothetical protein